MGWLFRLLALLGSWRRISSTVEQTKTSVQQARSTAQEVQQSRILSDQQKAEAGNVDAQFEMGARYYEGRGVPRDFQHAAHWFSRAAELGHVEAQSNLGMMYAVGRGVGRDRQAAKYWLLKASRAGSEPGRVALEKLMRQQRR